MYKWWMWHCRKNIKNLKAQEPTEKKKKFCEPVYIWKFNEYRASVQKVKNFCVCDVKINLK